MKVVICFLLTLPSMGEWSHSCCDVGNCQYLLFLIISFGYCKRVIVALLHRLHHSRWGNLYLCGLWLLWWYLSKQCFFFSACWLFFFLYYDSSTFFSLTSTCYYQLWIVFIMLLMVFSPFGLVWTRCLSLNVWFRLLLWWKNQTFLCFPRGLCSTKNLKRATGHLSPFSNNGQHTWLEIIVVMMENLYLCSFNAEQV